MSITDATVIKNFYVVTLPNGAETDLAEDVFGVLESAATEAIRSLVDHMAWPIPRKVREDIAGWAALQYLRGPSVRQLGREIAEGLSAVGISVKDENGKQVMLKMPTEGLAEPTGPSFHPARHDLPLDGREGGHQALAGVNCGRRAMMRWSSASSEIPWKSWRGV